MPVTRQQTPKDRAEVNEYPFWYRQLKRFNSHSFGNLRLSCIIKKGRLSCKITSRAIIHLRFGFSKKGKKKNSDVPFQKSWQGYSKYSTDLIVSSLFVIRIFSPPNHITVKKAAGLYSWTRGWLADVRGGGPHLNEGFLLCGDMAWWV